MNINKIIESIEKDFEEGKGMITLYGYENINELNQIKQKLENEGKYKCNISPEIYIDRGARPYQMIIHKSLTEKLEN